MLVSELRVQTIAIIEILGVFLGFITGQTKHSSNGAALGKGSLFLTLLLSCTLTSTLAPKKDHNQTSPEVVNAMDQVLSQVRARHDDLLLDSVEAIERNYHRTINSEMKLSNSQTLKQMLSLARQNQLREITVQLNDTAMVRALSFDAKALVGHSYVRLNWQHSKSYLEEAFQIDRTGHILIKTSFHTPTKTIKQFRTLDRAGTILSQETKVAYKN